MDGLIGGLSDRRDALGTELADITSTIADTSAAIPIELSSAGDVAIARSLSVASAQRVQVDWSPTMRGDRILDALRGEINFVYRGDPVAALGSA